MGISIKPEGFVTGSCDNKSKLKLTVHDVKFFDSQVKECSAKLIDENMLTMFDSEYFSITLTYSISDLKKDETAIEMVDKHFFTSNSQKIFIKTTFGWKL